MEQGVEQVGETSSLGERAPFEQSIHHRMRVALVVEPPQVVVIDGEERRRPRLETVRATLGFVDPAEQIENVGSLARLEQSVLLVESERDSRLTQVLANFGAVVIGPGKDVNIFGCGPARFLSLVTNIDCVFRFQNYAADRLCDSRTDSFPHAS